MQIRDLAVVIVGEHRSFEKALERWKKQVQTAGVINEVRRRRHYEPPSVRARAKRFRARRRVLRRAATKARVNLLDFDG